MEALLAAARAARVRAYAPYSGFRVGAAALGLSGEIYPGCNVENSSYGLTLCAERVALSAAVCGGEREILSLVVYTESDGPTPPCGACRQVLAELGREALVFAVCPSARQEWRVSDLLPEAFSARDILARRGAAGES